MRGILLDTNHLIWAATEPDRLSEEASALVADASVRLLVSVVGFWEIALKNRTQYPDGTSKLPLPDGLDPFEAFLTSAGVGLLDLTLDHVRTELSAPPDTKDPFDYVLLQQARAEGATLLTSEAKLRGHPLATYARAR